MFNDSLFPIILEKLIPPVVFLLFIWFGLGWLLPKAWSGIEWFWWRITLGRSQVGYLLREHALRDLRLLIREKELDDGIVRPLAVLFAIGSRLIGSRRMQRDLRKLRDEKQGEQFRTAIDNLNEGWRSGMPPQILKEYMQTIEQLAGGITDVLEKHRGLCAVANVRYLLGDLVNGNTVARGNWEYATKQEGDRDWLFKWMASYAYFNSTLFLGEFEVSMELMAKHWRNHYACLDHGERRKREVALSGILTLNPVLSIPRHIILAAAFNGSPILERQYWPNDSQYDGLSQEERRSELKWVESWYQEALRLCNDEPISLDFSHAYAGFYFTLLYDIQARSNAPPLDLDLRAKAEVALNHIGEMAPIVSRYVRWGFLGILKLRSGVDSENALNDFRTAAEYSAISGNKFADCLFMCCHAVAAQRVRRYLDPEVNYYLQEALKIANGLGRTFYVDLCQAATAEVMRLRGNSGRAERHTARAHVGRAGDRILSIFKEHQ